MENESFKNEKLTDHEDINFHNPIEKAKKDKKESSKKQKDDEIRTIHKLLAIEMEYLDTNIKRPASISKSHTNIHPTSKLKYLPKKQNTLDNLSIYTVTWNLGGKAASREHIAAILPEKKYDIYAIGSEECMRSIFKSFFYSNKSNWEQMIM
jgi:hypothetical protein